MRRGTKKGPPGPISAARLSGFRGNCIAPPERFISRPVTRNNTPSSPDGRGPRFFAPRSVSYRSFGQQEADRDRRSQDVLGVIAGLGPRQRNRPMNWDEMDPPGQSPSSNVADDRGHSTRTEPWRVAENDDGFGSFLSLRFCFINLLPNARQCKMQVFSQIALPSMHRALAQCRPKLRATSAQMLIDNAKRGASRLSIQTMRELSVFTRYRPMRLLLVR
jgi:hypothetical protein